MHQRFALLAAALSLTVLGVPAKAADGDSRDRADFEAAAGRAMLFEATSLAYSDPLKAPPADRQQSAARAPQPERRAVRVILPSPYAR